jgi:hypothetical protein
MYKTYEPEEIKGVRMLKKFEGYTVDLRLQQFRKVAFESFEDIEFIEFGSSYGQTLLRKMHASVSTKLS